MIEHQQYKKKKKKKKREKKKKKKKKEKKRKRKIFHLCRNTLFCTPNCFLYFISKTVAECPKFANPTLYPFKSAIEWKDLFVLFSMSYTH